MFFFFGPSVEPPKTALVKGVCLACQQEVEVKCGLGEEAPYVCPHCQERAVYTWLYCSQCNKRVIPQLERSKDGGPPRMPAHPSCPICGMRGIGAYIPELANDQTTDAPLPRWTP